MSSHNAARLAGTVLAMLSVVSATADSDLIRPRKEGFRELGAAFKNVNDELKSGTPQVYLIQLSARQIRDASRAQFTWFPAGSEPKAGVKTKAKPEIWKHSEEFKAAQDKFATEATAFMSVAAAGELPKIRLQARQLGQACKGCHEKFRIEDEE